MTFNPLWNGDFWFIVNGIKSRLISSIVAVEAVSVTSTCSIDCASKFRVADVAAGWPSVTRSSSVYSREGNDECSMLKLHNSQLIINH